MYFDMIGILNKCLKKYHQHIGLVMIQGGNALFPLLAFPIILSSIGTESFSKIVFSESIMMILFTIVVYSFDVMGVKDIQEVEEDNHVKEKLFYSILLFRLFVCLCLITLEFLLYLYYKDEMYILLMIWMLYPVGYALQSNYFYLANGNSIILGAIIVLVRIISIFLIFIFVDEYSSREVITMFLASSFLFSGLISYLYCYFFSLDRFFLISRYDAVNMLKKGIPILISNLSVGLFRGSNVIILGFLSTSGAVSIYSMAEKFIKTTQALMTPLNQLGLADFSSQYGKSVEPLNRLLWGCTKKQFAISISLVLIVISSLFISVFFLGVKYPDLKSVSLLYIIMSPAIIFGVLNYMYGMVGMNIVGLRKQFSFSVFISGLISVALSLLSVPFFGEYSAGVSYICGEMILFGLIYLSVRRGGNNEC